MNGARGRVIPAVTGRATKKEGVSAVSLRAKRVCVLPVLLAATLSWARDKEQNWIEVSSPHFRVICDGKEKNARHIAEQFERMRLVFHTAFPDMQIDPSSPIVVIAVNDNKTFRALEPEAYLAKGQLQLGGLFLRAPDKNYVLLRMDAGGDHPYATVYHEYTHLLLSKAPWIPLWLNEGLAEFYQNTDISQKGTVVGEASADNILWLRQNRLLSLPALLTVDQNSPYYHQEQKGSIFYAESWALTHYIQVQDAKNNTFKLRDYMLLVSNQVDPVTAATRTFGDLKRLQAGLESYIEQSSFNAFRLTKALPIDDASFKVQPLTPAGADAVRADFLAYNQRVKDSRQLLQQVLHDDPNNTLAHETMGYLEAREGRLAEAQHWYEQAVKLDSQSYLANYYFAAMSLNEGASGAETDAQIEASLLKAVKLNPSFAPAYDELALFYASRHKNLDQAHMLNLQAVQLDPGNVRFRVDAAEVLLIMQREADATAVLQAALKIAKTPEETMMVQSRIQGVQQVLSARAQNREEIRRLNAMVNSKEQASPDEAPAPERQPEQTAIGPHEALTGTLKNVHCSAPAVMDLDVESGGKTVALHTGNYYKVQFSALGFKPTGELRPCSDLEGRHAKVEYIESSAARANALLAVELYK